MDKRRKVLIVEDDRIFKAMLADGLEGAEFKVRTCGSLAEATDAIRKVAFDVALVDISLNGPHDMSDRDGLQVLSALRAAGDGTKAMVLSGHEDMSLMRDVWKEYGGEDYISKGDFEREGLDFLIKTIRRALKSRPSYEEPRWHSLIQAVAPDKDEAGFVHEMLRMLAFKGGLPVLQAGLLEAAKWLVPLLPYAADTPPLQTAIPGTFSARCWSKGQGCAVEIVISGTNADSGPLARRFAAGSATELYRRTKSGLTLLVVARPSLSRSRFANS